MSADNWAMCPRCLKRATKAVEEAQARVNAAYGVVPIEEFDAMRESVDADREALTSMKWTFREDYEFYGANEGVVNMSYRGECTECGLKLKIAEEHPIPGVDA